VSRYLDRYRTSIFQAEAIPKLVTLAGWMRAVHRRGKKTIFAGNGGSAAIAAHCAVDFTKNAGIRCINFNEADLITCFANDYGYEWWLQKALEFYADPGDLVILISSSGKSPNILNAARFTRAQGLRLATFSGFAKGNPLRSLGHLNWWVDSRAYNVIEMTHHIWLLAACDLIIGDAEYPAR
jgi:D-sedoheptulose 7-phosphate isomerase